MVLAPWYDLSDTARSFARDVPRHGLESPLLFSAIIAFAAIHRSCTGATSFRATAERYHSICIEHLINLDESATPSSKGVALAAVCLLRSYEIPAEDFDPNRHLQGAYALSEGSRIEFQLPSLLRAGFFNYLREDITYALINRCTLKIDPSRLRQAYEPATDEDQLNVFTLLLGRTINAAFGRDRTLEDLVVLREELSRLLSSLPSHFRPYCDTTSNVPNTYPSIYVLHDTHAATMQYHLVTDSILSASSLTVGVALRDLLEENAIRICGLAFTSSSTAVMVNSFGPMSFCCKFIRRECLQEDLEQRLLPWRKRTGWPLQRTIGAWKLHWQQYNAVLDEELSNAGESRHA